MCYEQSLTRKTDEVINKKNVLGKQPEELGVKDAIHVAIVSVRAAEMLTPGQRCSMNEFSEAVANEKGEGVVDPFLRGNVSRGENFQLLLDQTEIPNVRHVWEHPKVSFAAPTRPPVMNRTIENAAKLFGVTYQQIMNDAAFVVDRDRHATYSGTLSPEDFKKLLIDIEEGDADFETGDFWSEWADETGHEFYNSGSDCCPEYDYPGMLYNA